MRRLGLCLGAAGGIIGCFLAYTESIRPTWDQYAAYRNFEDRMASETMQKVAKAARAYRHEATGPLAYGANGQIGNSTPQATGGSFGGIPVDDERGITPGSAKLHGPWEKYGTVKVPPGYKLDAPDVLPPNFDQWDDVVSVDLDGIKEVTVNKAGLVSSIKFSTGESLQRVNRPAPTAFLIPLLYPLIGFLLPWAAVSLLTWVGTGFFAPR